MSLRNIGSWYYFFVIEQLWGLRSSRIGTICRRIPIQKNTLECQIVCMWDLKKSTCLIVSWRTKRNARAGSWRIQTATSLFQPHKAAHLPKGECVSDKKDRNRACRNQSEPGKIWKVRKTQKQFGYSTRSETCLDNISKVNSLGGGSVLCEGFCSAWCIRLTTLGCFIVAKFVK